MGSGVELLIALLLGLGSGFIAGHEWTMHHVEEWLSRNAGRLR